MDRSRWIRPLDALRALGRVRRDPGDTRAVFALLDALDGPLFEGWFRRFRATRAGRRILDEERDLLALLADRSWLSRLPDGSLGRAYADFADSEGLTPASLVEASRYAAAFACRDDGAWSDDQRARFAARLRDQHDLEHLVTGYGRERLGEAAVLAFDLGQLSSPGAALLVGLEMLRAGSDGRRVLLQAFRRGRRAAWLPATDWEALLEMSLGDVRGLLGIADPTPGHERSARASEAA